MPISYILFTIMKLLKEHNKKTTISKGRLSRVIGEFLIESFLPKEVKESLLQDFDYDYEIEMILDNYAGYLSDEDGMITLSPYTKINTIESLLEESSTEYDDDLIKIIDEFYDFNVPVFKMIGINIETQLYDKGIELERDISNSYKELAQIETCRDNIPNSIINNLKKNIIKRKILFSQMKMGLSLQEYNDLYRYSIERADLLNTNELALKINNEELDLIIEEDPFHRSLFFIDSDKELIFSNSFYRDSRHNSDEEKTKEMFYMKVIDIINDRTEKSEYEETDDDLIYAKYRLMYAMDMLYQDENNYNGYLFMNDRRNYIDYEEDYSFIEREIFYLIDELFMYTDKEMANNYIINYNNTIKSILIEAYYRLTKDERVIEAIKNHHNYGKYHFITELFNNIINKSKNKIKGKKEE